jgi:hypothetical protein
MTCYKCGLSHTTVVCPVREVSLPVCTAHGYCACPLCLKEVAGCSPPLTDLSPEDAIRRGRGNNDWINVKDRYPEKKEVRYLTLVPNEPRFQKYRLNVIQDRYFGSEDSWELEGVTHWMPLPDPPSGATMVQGKSCSK